MKRIKAILKRLYLVIEKPQMRILPGNLAFFLVLSIIPIITLIGFIASYFSLSIDSLVSFLRSALPNEINEILLPFIQGKGIDGNIIFYMITGFIVASNGAHSIILTSNIFNCFISESIYFCNCLFSFRKCNSKIYFRFTIYGES